jgi:DNA topoisomerase-1
MQNTTVADEDGRRLYELIWKRTMASQMADAELEKTTAKIAISTNKNELTATGEVMKFEGFTKVYRESRDDEDGPKKMAMPCCHHLRWDRFCH